MDLTDVVGISIVIPVYNNAQSLPLLCSKLENTFSDYDLQIILVDDYSTDDSAIVANTLNAEVIINSENIGQNASILEGMKSVKHPFVAVMDADFEDDPRKIPWLLNRLIEDPMLSVSFSARVRSPRITSKAFRVVMKIIYPNLPLGACLHFVCRKKVVDALVRIGDEEDYLIALIGSLKVRTTITPVKRGSRVYGESGYPGLKRWKHAAGLFRASLRRRVLGPIRTKPQ